MSRVSGASLMSFQLFLQREHGEGSYEVVLAGMPPAMEAIMRLFMGLWGGPLWSAVSRRRRNRTAAMCRAMFRAEEVLAHFSAHSQVDSG